MAQAVVKAPATPSRVEPGLEQAVAWKWWVAPPANPDWGMPLPASLVPKPAAGDPAKPEPVKPVVVRPETYEVKKGDAMIKIARKFDMTVAQLKQFNELPDDRIKIGQVLRIPTAAQLLTLVPPPPPADPKKDDAGKQKKSTKPAKVVEPEPEISGDAQRELDNVLVQVFLDREMFSPGLIDGKAGATYQKISELYQRTHPDAANSNLLKVKAETALKQPYTQYVLRAEDFKFIKAPAADPPAAHGKDSSASRKKGAAKEGKAAPPPHVTIDQLVAADFLAYTSAWEFVAERFHCDEAFLHHINPHLKGTPVVGTGFQVPNVIPFEIESAFDAPLQPAANPQKPVTAAVVLVSRLEISCEGKLVAVMPLASARPGLHGRGAWKILDAIARPRMATKREPRETPKEKPAASSASTASAAPAPALAPPAVPVPAPAQPAPPPPLENEQYLAPGPNNPVGIIWLNLAKAGGNEPLPYGLHGTGIPSQMATLQGIGGLRLTNWDIVRATRLLPPGTPLQWKAQ